jgi:hypothetical protein
MLFLASKISSSSTPGVLLKGIVDMGSIFDALCNKIMNLFANICKVFPLNQAM